MPLSDGNQFPRPSDLEDDLGGDNNRDTVEETSGTTEQNHRENMTTDHDIQQGVTPVRCTPEEIAVKLAKAKELLKANTQLPRQSGKTTTRGDRSARASTSLSPPRKKLNNASDVGDGSSSASSLSGPQEDNPPFECEKHPRYPLKFTIYKITSTDVLKIAQMLKRYPKIEGYQSMGPLGTTKYGSFRGNWMCGVCGGLNFASRRSCSNKGCNWYNIDNEVRMKMTNETTHEAAYKHVGRYNSCTTLQLPYLKLSTRPPFGQLKEKKYAPRKPMANRFRDFDRENPNQPGPQTCNICGQSRFWNSKFCPCEWVPFKSKASGL